MSVKAFVRVRPIVKTDNNAQKCIFVEDNTLILQGQKEQHYDYFSKIFNENTSTETVFEVNFHPSSC